MCLKLTKTSKRDTKRIRNYTNNKTIKVYKLVRKALSVEGEPTYNSIFFAYKCFETFQFNKKFLSTRASTDVNDIELETKCVNMGIHVFLKKDADSIKKAIHYMKNDCFVCPGTLTLLECEADRLDLVSVGTWDESKVRCAVFTMVTPLKVIKEYQI